LLSFLFGSFGRLIFSEFLFIFGFLFGLSTRSRTLKETREADGGSCKKPQFRRCEGDMLFFFSA
jgi:hypothetical protein